MRALQSCPFDHESGLRRTCSRWIAAKCGISGEIGQPTPGGPKSRKEAKTLHHSERRSSFLNHVGELLSFLNVLLQRQAGANLSDAMVQRIDVSQHND